VLTQLGKYEEAETMLRHALESIEKALGLEHPDTLTSVSLLGLVLERQDKYEEAETMLRHVLESREKALGLEHPDTLTSFSHLGFVFYQQGKYEEAEAMHHRALESKNALGLEHPATKALPYLPSEIYQEIPLKRLLQITVFSDSPPILPPWCRPNMT
jgi:tetratricopeptide (TPR) repeat protein